MHHPAAVRRDWFHELRNRQRLPHKSIGFVGGIAVDVLVLEFIGLAMVALCIIVLAVPSKRPPVRHLID
jgi:hypothetical protein